MSRVFWDSNLFIYLIEDTGERGKKTRALAERIYKRGDELFASTLCLGEVLVIPYRRGDLKAAAEYEGLFARLVQLIPFDVETARSFAKVRRDQTIRAPDAILLACAARVGIDYFFTNDENLTKKYVPGIGVITTLDASPI